MIFFIFVFIIAFLVISYILLFAKKNKAKKQNETTSVEKYHSQYIERREELRKHRDSSLKTKNFTTKYNSSIDYREK